MSKFSSLYLYTDIVEDGSKNLIGIVISRAERYLQYILSPFLNLAMMIGVESGRPLENFFTNV